MRYGTNDVIGTNGILELETASECIDSGYNDIWASRPQRPSFQF